MFSAIWPSQTIEAAVASGVIGVETPLDFDQIQPASLDLRLGDRAYRVSASFLPGARSVSDCLVDLTTETIDLSQPTVLGRGWIYIIPLLEWIGLPSRVEARANPKSSSGRLDVFVRIITDHGAAFDAIRAGYHGPLYAEVSPRSFPIRVSRGARLAQIRFREYVRDDIGPPSERPRFTARKLPVTVDLDSDARPDGVIGYRARPSFRAIDLSLVGGYRIEDYWEPVFAHHKRLTLSPGELYILASAERVVVRPHEAAEMIAYDVALGEFRNHAAGFVDPNFGLDNDRPNDSRIVFEVRAHDVPFLIEHGQALATLAYEPVMERPDRLYGAGLGSNYQGQRLRLSKQFAQPEI